MLYSYFGYAISSNSNGVNYSIYGNARNYANSRLTTLTTSKGLTLKRRGMYEYRYIKNPSEQHYAFSCKYLKGKMK